MPIRSLPAGNSITSFNAIAGTPTSVNLVTVGSGNLQNGYVCPSDRVYVSATNASNTALTLPDPAKLGMSLGDEIDVFVYNVSNGVIVFPPTGGSINNAAVNTFYPVGATGAILRFILVSPTSGASQWIAA